MSHNHSFKHLSFLSIPARLGLALGLLIVALGTMFVILSLAQPGNPALDPPRNSHSAPLTTTVSITYDEPMDPTTVTSRTFAVHGMQSGLVTETHGVVNGGYTIIVTPTHAFHQGELVYAIATTQTTNITGTVPLAATQWQFNAGEITNRCVEGFDNISAALTGVEQGSAAWGDYDGDGDLDILLAGQNSSFVPVTEVWRNGGGGSFSQQSTAPTGVSWSDAAWGDYDNDGDLDILLAGYTGSTQVTEVWRNDGGGSFSQVSTAPTGVVITDSIPVSVTSPTVVGSSGAAITLTGSAPNFVWDVANLVQGEGGVITLTGVLNEPLAAGVFTNTAEIACAETEGDETNNSSDAALTVQNVAPVANAGNNQTAPIRTTVTLDGSGSSDANGDALTYDWAQIGGPSVALSSATAESPTFAAPGSETVLTFTLTVTDSHGLADPTPDEVVITVRRYTYLPLVARNYVVAPDLVVQSVTATSDNVQVVIENQGNAPVTDEFWVEAYINPDPAPTAVNQLWWNLGDEGMFWSVTEDLLPLNPGETITLTYNDATYTADYSRVSWPLASGTVVYAQADAYNADTTYGAIQESHEITGGAYDDNIGNDTVP